MVQRLRTNYPSFDDALDEYLGPIRQLTIRKLLTLFFMLEFQRQHHGPLWVRYQATVPEGAEQTWEGFIFSLKGVDIARLMFVSTRTALDYLLAVQKLSQVF